MGTKMSIFLYTWKKNDIRVRESGTGLRYIQELLGHKSSKTTDICTHVTNKGIGKIKSPFDNLQMKGGLKVEKFDHRGVYANHFRIYRSYTQFRTSP